MHQTNPSAADADGDGAPDADEVMAGTSPTDPGSVLGVRLVPDGPDGWRLEWPGASNRVYLVNVATELPPSRYTILAEDLPAALPTTVFDLPGATNVTRFYWIEVK